MGNIEPATAAMKFTNRATALPSAFVGEDVIPDRRRIQFETQYRYIKADEEEMIKAAEILMEMRRDRETEHFNTVWKLVNDTNIT